MSTEQIVQVILMGTGAGMLIGLITFFVNWGITQVLKIIKSA